MKRLTKQNLRAYLEAHKEQQYPRGKVDVCPIAGFYTEQGVPVVSVWPEDTYFRHRHIRNPRWAARFISKVDFSGNGPITGGEALAILEAL